MKELSKQLKAIANERRLKILILLLRGQRRTVGDIADAIKLSFRSTSRHFQRLENAGFLEHEQVGPHVYFWLNKNHAVFKCFSSLLYPAPFRVVLNLAERIIIVLHPRSKLRGIQERCGIY